MIPHKQNDILLVLTMFSVIMLPLTLISGIYGMNFATSRSTSAPTASRTSWRMIMIAIVHARVLPLQAVDLSDGAAVGAVAAGVHGRAATDGGCIFCAKPARG